VTISSSPPPLPWKFRTAPERWFLTFAAASAVVVAGFMLASQYLHLPWVCAWRGMTGLPCAGCGGTRAAVLVLQGEWWRALILNPGVVLGSAVVAAAGVYALAVVLLRMEPWRPRFSGWRWMLAVAVAANWLYLLTVSRS
jgi:hypothetical protein